MLAGERILPAGAYPMEGRLRLSKVLPGSPAAETGRLRLSMFEMAEIYRDLTGGDLPKVISNRARMGKAYGRYFVGKNRIELAAQIFGILDESDVAAVRAQLIQQGYFRHLDPAWSAKMKPETRNLEERRSEARLEKEIRKLAERKVKFGEEARAPRVFAHELWHMIDDQDGGLRGRGTLVGRLAALKHYMKEAFPVEGFAGNAELRREAAAFIPWWRGVSAPEDTAYFMKDSAETLAEMGAAFFVDPDALKQRAPLFYDALSYALAQHPKAQEAYDNVAAYVADRGSRIGKTIAGTWTKEYADALRRVGELARQKTMKRDLARDAVYMLWDRRSPAIMLFNESQAEAKRSALRNYREGLLSKGEYLAQVRAFRNAQEELEKAKLGWTRDGPNHARLFLADMHGIFEKALGAVDKNPDVAWTKVAEYAFYRRVIELKGRAAAYAVTPADARRRLNETARLEGLSGMRAIKHAAAAFRSIYQKSVLEHPHFVPTFGEDFQKLCLENADYVTMRHTMSAEKADTLVNRLLEATPGKALDLVSEELRVLYGGSGRTGALGLMKPLKGSIKPVVDPLLETMKTAVHLLAAMAKNHSVMTFADALSGGMVTGGTDADGNPKSRFGWGMGSPLVRVYEAGHEIVPAGFEALAFLKEGRPMALVAPRIVVAGFQNGLIVKDVDYLTMLSRFSSHWITTANPAFTIPAYVRDLHSARVNVRGLGWTPQGALLPPDVGIGSLALWGAFGKARWAHALARTPLVNLFFNERHLAYWLPIAREVAGLVRSGRLQERLEEADVLRERGETARADALEYSVYMAREAMSDGVLLHMNQQRMKSYEQTDWVALQRKFALRFGPRSAAMRAFARDLLTLPFDGGGMGWKPKNAHDLLTRVAPRAVAWPVSVATKGLLLPVAAASGDTTELLAATVKLAAYLALHKDVRPGHLAAPSMEDGALRRRIALKAALDAGDPPQENRGASIGPMEVFWRMFLNVAMKCAVRPIRKSFGEAFKGIVDYDAARFWEGAKDLGDTAMKLGVDLGRLWFWSSFILYEFRGSL